MRPGNENQRGFALIELLVSLTLLGLILALLAGALRVMGKNWDANAGRIETLDMMSRAFDILARDAGNLQRLAAASPAPAFLFNGGPDSLSFVALEPPQPAAAGLYFIDYSVAPNGGNGELIRARAQYRRGMERFPGATPANRVSLLRGPYAYRFSYGGGDAGNPSWYADWPFPNRLPELIRLEVTERSGRQPAAPAMIVRVRADVELDCLAPAKSCSVTAAGQPAPSSPSSSSERARR
jgi:general secretion pathway protein J